MQTESQSFPLESLKSVHVLKKNGTNLRSPVPRSLPLLGSLLCAPAVSSQLRGPATDPSPPIGGDVFGSTLRLRKLLPYK